MTIEFKDLPYAQDALEPVYSTKTVQLHYGKHHRTYFDKMTELIKDTPYADMNLEEIIKATARDKKQTVLFNNAAQVWNHDVFWRSMKPGGGGSPNGDLEALIGKSFKGGLDGFKKELKNAAVTRFGSGWAWLTFEGGKLKISSTSNAENPLATGKGIVLLTIDVWEHAYYLDYQNKRPDFVDAFLDKLVNWDYAAERLKMAQDGDAHAETPLLRDAA
jgi:superoxide dismutase, Fe-Mn family